MTIEKIDSQSEELVLSDHIFELPSVGEVDKQYEAIMQFQNAVRTNLKEGLQRDYGTIPGTHKPTLLKPGAEKIMRLARVACEYTIINQVEDWDRPLFSYTVKCHVRIVAGGPIIEEGLGEANTLEAQNANKNAFTLKNTVLKMAKKRALVDAALAIGRLSDLFTQDIDDDPKTFTVSSRGGGGSSSSKPSAAQFSFLVDLGYQFEEGEKEAMTRREASAKIEELTSDSNQKPAQKQVPDDEPIFSDDDFITGENMSQKDLEKACKSQGWGNRDLNDALGKNYQDYLQDNTPYMAWFKICSVKKKPNLV